MNDRVWPGPGDLADYLVGKKKATGRLGSANGGRCCLGHYGDMCGLDYKASDSLLEGLPRGHWMALPVIRLDSLQDQLAHINDTTTGFDAVIAKLDEIEAAS